MGERKLMLSPRENRQHNRRLSHMDGGRAHRVVVIEVWVVVEAGPGGILKRGGGARDRKISYSLHASLESRTT